MEIWKKDKDEPWLKRLLGIKTGKKAAVEFKSRATVRSIISDRIVNDYPEIELVTRKAVTTIDGEEIKYLEVERIK